MPNYISNTEKRIKYCIYKKNLLNEYKLVAMTMYLSRVERLINVKIKVNLEDVIKNVGDYYIHENYLIRAEKFKY